LLQVYAAVVPGHCANVADGERNLSRLPVDADGALKNVDNQTGIKGIGLRGNHIWCEFPPGLEQGLSTVGG
jgi:hypothetical protein